MGLLVDGLIIIAYFVAITIIGLTRGRQEKSLNDFALGGRRVPWWVVMASIIAAETSAATFLGAPGEGYEKRSLAYVQLVFGLILGRFVVGQFFLKPYYTYRVYTVYDYLEIRFGKGTKAYVSRLFLVMRTLASGTRLFVPSLVMVLAWRLFTGGGEANGSVRFSQTSVDTVFPYLVAIILLTLATALYTVKGGIKAVLWTDVIQAILMFGSALIAIATLLIHVGGWSGVISAVPEMTRLEGYFLHGFEPARVALWQRENGVASMGIGSYLRLILESDYTIFSALIGAGMLNMAAFGTDQDMVQRMLTAETYQKARRSLMTAAVMDLPIAASFTFIGILLYAYYLHNPAFKPTANSDVFGSYILNVMPSGIRGLVLAGVMATAMGSLSAALNALATSATNDLYLPHVRDREPEHYVAVARLFTALFAVLMVLIAGGFAWAKVHNPDLRIIPVVLGIAGFILGPMLGVFLIGMFTRNRGSDKGNALAITVGLCVTTLLGGNGKFWTFLLLPKVSFIWFALIGATVVVAIGLLFRTPPEALETARRTEEEAARNGGDLPVSLR
ncbi:MAG: sodium/solute symporter [Chthonomonadaceae bacterium]|nr:sodium/solute symporter [Chthonomonadaceae bacterium]